jgi:hypothetical protein
VTQLLTATCVFLASSGVCMCVCVYLGLYAILVSPRFMCAVIFAVAGSLIATCVLLSSRVYGCVRPGRLHCG